LTSDENQENKLRCAIHLKHNLVDKASTVEEQTFKEYISVLSEPKLLLLPAKVSAHISLTIGKIINKHLHIDLICGAITEFVSSKVLVVFNDEAAYSNGTCELMLGHLKNILKQLSTSKLTKLSDCTWAIGFMADLPQS